MRAQELQPTDPAGFGALLSYLILQTPHGARTGDLSQRRNKLCRDLSSELSEPWLGDLSSHLSLCRTDDILKMDRWGAPREGLPRAWLFCSGKQKFFCAHFLLVCTPRPLREAKSLSRDTQKIASSPREGRSSKERPLSLPCFFFKRFLTFTGPSPPGGPPGCPSPRTAPASELLPALPGSENHRPPLTDSWFPPPASRGALWVCSSSFPPVSLQHGQHKLQIDARVCMRTRCQAGLRSSSQGPRGADYAQVFTCPQGLQPYHDQDSQGGTKQPLLLVPSTPGPDHRRRGGGKLRLKGVCTASV